MVIYLGDQLANDCTAAQKNRDTAKVAALRQLRSAFHNAEIAVRGQLAEAASIKFLQQQLRQREESAAIFKQAGRLQQWQQEEQEAEIIRGYLPPALSTSELEAMAKQAVIAAGAKGFGAAMAWAMQQVKGRATGQEVSAAIKKATEEK